MHDFELQHASYIVQVHIQAISVLQMEEISQVQYSKGCVGIMGM